MDMRAEVWSPLQNIAVWLGAWLHGHESTDDVLVALKDLGGLRPLSGGGHVIDLLARLRNVADVDGEEPVLRLILAGPGEPPALPAGSPAAVAAYESNTGAIVVRDVDQRTNHILVLREEWEWFSETEPLPPVSWLTPGEADSLLTEATNRAAAHIESSGYRTDALTSPRLTVGTLADFYDTPGLPSAVPPRAAKLFARADNVAAIVETVTARMGDHSLDPQLLSLWRHIRAARMAGVAYALVDFAR